MVENANQELNEGINNGDNSLSLSLDRINLDDFSMDDLNNVDSPSEKTKPEAKEVNSASVKPQDKVVEQKKEIVTDKNGQRYEVKSNALPVDVKINKSDIENSRDFLRDNKEVSKALWKVTERFRKYIDNEYDFSRLIKMSKFNPDLTKQEISDLYNFIQKGEFPGLNLSNDELAEKVKSGREILGVNDKNIDNYKLSRKKMLQIVLGKLKPEFLSTMVENGGIDGYIGGKTLDALENFLKKMEFWFPIFDKMKSDLNVRVKSTELPFEIEKPKDEGEVWKVVFPEKKKNNLISGTISVAASKGTADNKSSIKNIDQNNNELTEGYLRSMSISGKPIEIGSHFNKEGGKGVSAQINSSGFESNVKNKDEYLMTQDDLQKILDNASKFIDEYVRDNAMDDGEELNFELQPQIHTEKKVIKFKVKREGNNMNIYMDGQEKPIDSRLWKGSLKVSVRGELGVDAENGQRNYENGDIVATKVEIEKPLSKNISYVGNAGGMYYNTGIKNPDTNQYQDFGGVSVEQGVRIRDNKNTISIDGTLNANRLKLNGINDMAIGGKMKLDYHPEDSKFSGNAEAARNQPLGRRGEANLGYKINDKIKLNTGVMYNNAIETPGKIQGMDKWLGKISVETKHIVASGVFNKSYQAVSLSFKF